MHTNRLNAFCLDEKEAVRRGLLNHISSNGYRSTLGRLKTWCGADHNLSVFLKSIHGRILRLVRRDEIGATENEGVIFSGQDRRINIAVHRDLNFTRRLEIFLRTSGDHVWFLLATIRSI